MKQITHEETRKVIVIDGYMADDGTRFNSEWECEQHERDQRRNKLKAECKALKECQLTNCFEIANSLYCTDNDNTYRFSPKSQEDIDKLLAYFDESKMDYSVSDPGNKELYLKDYFVFESEVDNFVAIFSREYVEKRYKDYIEQMFGKED